MNCGEHVFERKGQEVMEDGENVLKTAFIIRTRRQIIIAMFT
jgi:hypothetical protein